MKNKNVLITGGCGFIGSKLCLEYLKLNYNVFCIDRKKKEGFNFINSLEKKYKKKFNYYNCDLEKLGEIKIFIKKIKKKINNLDIIINNASITGDSLKKGWNTKFENQNYLNFNKAIKVNLISVFEICKNFKKLLQNSSSASIINISSIYANLCHDKDLYVGTKINNPAAYSTSKAGLNQLTRWMAAEFAPKVRVNCVSPGGIYRKQSKKFVSKYIKKTLLKRMATESEIVDLILFLASEKAKYITGQEIVIDGGYSIK